MLYKVVIVDDEKIMREGLSSIIDWKTMGFEVAAKLEDGQDAIEYIDRNPVDVVLTDIKMTFVSGIELSKYIYERHLPIKVVLISGYQEFDLARQAIAYGVADYLLKPPRLKNIEKVFIEIKQQLDKEDEEKKRKIQKNEQYEELQAVLKEEFIMDLVLGTLRNQDEINHRIKLLDLRIDLQNSWCCLVDFIMEEVEIFLCRKWEFDRERLYFAIHSFFLQFSSVEADFSFHPFRSNEDSIQVLVFSQKPCEMERFIPNIRIVLENIRSGIKDFFGLETHYQIGRQFSNIFELSSDASIVSQLVPDPGSGTQAKIEEVSKRGKMSEGNVITRVKEYIGDNFNKDITLENIAGDVYLNPVYLSRLFKEQTGENYIDYLIEVRMKKAIEILKDFRYRVHEISRMVGYENVKYFYTIFKRYTGQTPTEYRRILYREGGFKNGKG